ncbi:hypothetical protein [Erwinia sp. ErVv1]|uniref:hypothetical protein n=1 Tax=Erwinia sp. ErVv1 TaxID=1603299 RepID=UPI000830596A|nr:hypothetical protein [Erwinia sp. ErVv1]
MSDEGVAGLPAVLEEYQRKESSGAGAFATKALDQLLAGLNKLEESKALNQVVSFMDHATAILPQFGAALGTISDVVARTTGHIATAVNYVIQVSGRFEQLGWRAQQAGMSAADTQGLDYAGAQTGVGGDALLKAVTALADRVKSSPESEALLNRLGVTTRDDKGQLSSAGQIFNGASSKLAALPQAQAADFASRLNINPQIATAMRQGLGEFSAEYARIVDTLGVNMSQVTASGHHMMTAQRRISQVGDLVQAKSGSRLMDGLADSFDRLSGRLLENAPDIERTLGKVVDILLSVAEVGERVVVRLVQGANDLTGWWDGLDNGTKQLITILGEVTVAWMLLNSAFLLSPIGIIAGLGVAILALYDDYKTWQEGGKSLIDWDTWAPGIAAAKTAIGWLVDKFNKLNQGTLDWKEGLQTLSDFLTGNWSPDMIAAVEKVKAFLNRFFTEMGKELAEGPFVSFLHKVHFFSDKDIEDMKHSFTGLFSPDGTDEKSPKSGVQSALSGPAKALNAQLLMLHAASIQATDGRQASVSEVNSVNQDKVVNLQQETHINVSGSADPVATAWQVKQHQHDVNAYFVEQASARPT